MKTRQGFVSNSSSSSFVIIKPQKPEILPSFTGYVWLMPFSFEDPLKKVQIRRIRQIKSYYTDRLGFRLAKFRYYRRTCFAIQAFPTTNPDSITVYHWHEVPNTCDFVITAERELESYKKSKKACQEIKKQIRKEEKAKKVKKVKSIYQPLKEEELGWCETNRAIIEEAEAKREVEQAEAYDSDEIEALIKGPNRDKEY
jgi:hypothetical protein